MNDVRKRFIAKNVSGNTRDVKVELKVEVTNVVAIRRFWETEHWLPVFTTF